MPVSADFTIDYVNQRIRRADSPGSTDVYDVNDLYSYLQNTFDELDQMDDDVPMSAQTPTEYTMINGWILLEECIPFFKNGAIQTSGWDASANNNGIRILEFETVGYTSAVAGDIGREVGYSGGTPADTGTLLDYDNTLRKWWVRVDDTGDTFANTATAIDLDNGTGTGAGTLNKASVTGESLWANAYTLGTIADTPYAQVYIFQADESLSEWWPEDRTTTGHIDALIKVKEADVLIDSGYITVFCRNYGDLFDHFEIDLSAGGRNAVPLATAPDLNNYPPDGNGELYLDVADTTGFAVGNFAEGGTSGAYGEIVEVDGTNDYLYLGNVIGTFQTSETIHETTDPSDVANRTGDSSANNASTAYTNVVAGYGSGIDIYSVSGEIDVDTTGGSEPALYETMTGGTYSSTAIILKITVSGTWGSGGTAVITIGNATGGFANNESVTFTGGGTAAINDLDGVDGTVVTVDRNFSQQSSYNYNMVVDLGGDTVFDMYEYFKYVCREDSVFSIYSYNSGIRLINFVVAGYTDAVEGDIGRAVTGGTTGDSGTLLAYNNTTRVWTVKMDACTGTPANDDLFDEAETVSVSGGTGTGTTIGGAVPAPQDGEEYIQAMPHYSPVKSSPLGTFAGGTYFGPRGLWIEDMATADANAYQLIDSANATQTPPSQVPVKITGLEAGDRGGVFLATGDNYIVDKNQYDIQTTHTAPVSEIKVDTSGGDIPNDTPATGTIVCVRRDSGGTIIGEERYAYTSWNNDNSPTYGSFLISGSTSEDLDTDDTAYVPYAFGVSDIGGTDIEKTVQYVSDRYVVARVRHVGILPFQTKGTLDNSGYTATAIRTTDSIVTYSTTTTTTTTTTT